MLDLVRHFKVFAYGRIQQGGGLKAHCAKAAIGFILGFGQKAVNRFGGD